MQDGLQHEDWGRLRYLWRQQYQSRADKIFTAAASAHTQLVSSASTASTSAVNVSGRRAQISASSRYAGLPGLPNCDGINACHSTDDLVMDSGGEKEDARSRRPTKAKDDLGDTSMSGTDGLLLMHGILERCEH